MAHWLLLFHTLMLRLLPVERPQQLVSLYQTGGWVKGTMSYPLFQEIATRSDLFTGLALRKLVAVAGVSSVSYRFSGVDRLERQWGPHGSSAGGEVCSFL